MTPSQAQLWQLLALPSWRCVHPERLPFAPAPTCVAATVLIVLGPDTVLPDIFMRDVRQALSLPAAQLQCMAEADWLAAETPAAQVVLGLNLTQAGAQVSWHGRLPLTAGQKQTLWSCLCRLYFAP